MNNRVNLFNNLNKNVPAQQNVDRNQNNNLTNLGFSSNSNNAPKSPVPNESRNPTSRNQSHYFLSDKRQQNYFCDLQKLIPNQKIILLLQKEIAQCPLKQEWIKTGTDLFSPSPQKEKQFQGLYRGTSNLKMSSIDLGFRNALLAQSKKLDDVWFRIIDVLRSRLGTNSMMAVKMSKRYIKESGIYKKFYISQIRQDVLKPNQNQIQRFFLASNPNQVDQKSPQFILIVQKIANLYYEEYKSCLYCLSRMIWLEKFNKIFQDKAHQISFLQRLWNSYKVMSSAIIKNQPNASKGQDQADESYYGLIKSVFERNTRLLTSITKLIYQAIVHLYDFKKIQAAFANAGYGFYEQFVKKLDQDIINFEKIDICSNIRAENFTKLITQLFLCIFPFEIYDTPVQNTKIDKINRELANTKSEALTTIRMLLLEKQSSDMIRKFQQLVKQGLWNINNFHWKKWIGLFLKKYAKYFNKNTQRLLNRIVGICKLIVGKQCDEFWSCFVNNSYQKDNKFYLLHIKEFIRRSIDEQIQFWSFSNVLPIVTRLLGTLRNNYWNEVIDFVDPSKIKMNVIDLIIDTLKLNASPEELKYRQRILYTSQIKQESIQQETKFLCRLVCLSIEQLPTLEKVLMDGMQQSCGLRITFMLIRCLQKIVPERSQDLKLLRYLTQAIDAIFLYEQTRILVPIALGASQTSKQSHKKQLRSIIDICVHPPQNNQMNRQSIKLRKVLGLHLNHIVKLSDSLQQYFPTATRTEDEGAYKRLYDYIIQQEDSKILDFLNDPCLKSVPWLYYLLLILESDRLNAVDFDTVRLLLLKMRFKDKGSKQQVSLNLVGEMLNNGKLTQQIVKYITPLIMTSTFQNKQRYVFGLSNRQFQLFMGSSVAAEIKMPSKYNYGSQQQKISGYSDLKYANKVYLLQKRKKEMKSQKMQLYARLSGSISIIQTILKLNLQDQYPLIQKLTLNKFIIEGLLSQKAYMFDVRFNAKFQNNHSDKTQSDKQTLQTLFSTSINKKAQPIVQRELQIKISMLHSIISLVNFENRMKIDRWNHPSHILKLGGIVYVGIEEDQDQKISPQIIERSRQNILTEVTKQSETIGISSVYRILEYLILLGHGRTVYYSLLYRNYPTNHYFPEASTPSQFVDQFFQESIRLLTTNHISMRQKGNIIEFFSVCLQQNHLSEYIVCNLHKFKDAFIRIWKQVFQCSISTIITQVLLFFNLLLIKNSTDKIIKFVKNCLVDPLKYGMELIRYCRFRFNLPRKLPSKQIIYNNLQWCSKTMQIAACKASLLLYLGISSYLISSQHQILASGLCQLIIKEGDTFLIKVPDNLQIIALDQLNLSFVHQYRQRVQIRGNLDITCFGFSKLILDTLILDSPCSITQNYVYQPWQIYSKARSKHLNQRYLVLQGLKINALTALHFMNQALIQYFYLLSLSFFERAVNGYFFNDLNNKHQSDQQTSTMINFMSKKSKNGLSTTQLIGEGESILKKCFRLYRVVSQQIWSFKATNRTQLKTSSQNSGMMLLATILKSIADNLILQQNQSQQMTQAFKILDKLFIQINTQQLKCSLRIMIYVFQQAFRLNQKLLTKSYTNKCNTKCSQDYFTRINEILQFLMRKIGSPIKIAEKDDYNFNFLALLLLFLQKNIQNHEFLNHSKEYLEFYLDNSSRYQFLQNTKKIILLYFPLLQNLNLKEHIRGLIIQIFNKALYIDTISKRYSRNSIISKSFNYFTNYIQKIIKNLSETEVETMIFISGLLAEAGIYQGEVFSRPIIKIIKVGLALFQKKLLKHNEIRSLEGIVQMKNILSLFSAVGSDQNWHNTQLKQMLNHFFVLLQQKPIKFQSARIIPSSQFQRQLRTKNIPSDQYKDQYKTIVKTDSHNKSIFQILTLLRLHQYFKSYLLFMTCSIKNSDLLIDLCDRTFSQGKLDEMTWQRIKFSLMSGINYCQKLTQLFEQSFLHQIIFINRHICVDGEYLTGLGVISFYFQNYESVQDLGCDIYQTVFLLYNTLTLFMSTWKGYDWKSRIDWKSSRKDLWNNYLNLLNRYTLFVRVCKSTDYELKLNAIKSKVKEAIEFNELTV